MYAEVTLTTPCGEVSSAGAPACIIAPPPEPKLHFTTSRQLNWPTKSQAYEGDQENRKCQHVTLFN